MKSINGKTAHGLIRYSKRFKIEGILDKEFAEQDAGFILDGKARGIKIYEDLHAFLSQNRQPDYCILGIALPGGKIPELFLNCMRECLKLGIGIINGSHVMLSEIEEFKQLALANKAKIVDVRKTKPKEKLSFWSGEILKVKKPIVAVMGSDCAAGKRTTATFIKEQLENEGKKAEIIYTGQTGWMQGNRYGFILDSTLNDFVSGELERSILTCVAEVDPDVVLIEGQSSLTNPSGPCGSEFILSGRAKQVVFHCTPFRKYYDGLDEYKLTTFSIEDEIRLIEMYGAKVIAITVNRGNASEAQLKDFIDTIQKKFDTPVIDPLNDSLQNITKAIRMDINTL